MYYEEQNLEPSGPIMGRASVSSVISREIRLISRPHGVPTAENFSITRSEIIAVREGEVLVRKIFMSVDPLYARPHERREVICSPVRAGKSLEMGGYLRSGKLKNKETVVNGIDHAVEAFIGLFHGQNVGKMVVKLT